MTKTFTGKYRFRLLIGLPLVVICFTLATGFLPLGMIDYSLGRVERPIELRSIVLDLKLAVLAITFVATSLAVAISLYIVRPVERMIHEMDELAGQRQQGAEARPTDDEIDRLSKVYNQTFVPVRGYLTSAELFLQMSEGIVGLNADARIAFLNAPVEQLLAIRRQDYIGKNYQELFPNSRHNLEVHELIEGALHDGTIRTRDILVSTASGRDVYLRATASPATGRKNEPIGVVILFHDIEELGRLKDQLRKIDVLASLGGTITGMAHEVKTPLGYIRSLVELIAEDLPKDAPQQKHVGTIMESIDRLNSMVEDILSLASVKVDPASTYDPVVIVRESVAYVREAFVEKGLRLAEDYPDTIQQIKGDRERLIESFMNILKNASEASPSGAAVTVRIRPVVLGTSSRAGQDTVMIEFHNEGSYITPDKMQKLFIPFFTTKKQGTGLGLAITKQIIEAHEGAIHIESDPHTGTLFRVLLPAVTPSPMPAGTAV